MKKADVLKAMKLSWILVLAVMVGFSSCNKDDDDNDDNPVIVLDGMYVIGAATDGGADYVEAQMMSSTKNEVDQTDRAMLYELYIPH
jgi:hypothetical protein